MKAKKLLIRFLFFSLGILSTSYARCYAEEVLTQKNLLSLSVGGYRIKAGKASIGSLGALRIDYKRALTPKWGIEGAFENGLNLKGGFSSIYWGFDLGGMYALGAPFAKNTVVSDVVTVHQDQKWGVLLGAGFSLRAIPLAAGTITYSGTYIAVQPIYRLNESLVLLARGQLSLVYNASQALTPLTGLVGLGFNF